MDVVLRHHGVGGRQVQKVVVARLGALELVLVVLGLPLEGRGGEERSSQRRDTSTNRGPRGH